MKEARAQAALVAQQQALDAYFHALFQCEAAVPVPETVPAMEVPELQAEPAAIAATLPVEQSANAVADAPDQSKEIASAAAGTLRVQMFTVAGLTLAVPLERLQTVLKSHAETVDLFEGAQLIAGTVTRGGTATRIVDTARLVLPEEHAAKLPAEAAERCGHLLIIGDGRWALGCSDLNEVAELAEGDVTWRTAAGKRPWLAGMAAQRRCALVDVDGLIRLLDDSMA